MEGLSNVLILGGRGGKDDLLDIGADDKVNEIRLFKGFAVSLKTPLLSYGLDTFFSISEW